ncbi:MAG: PIN domain-containing protein [Nitrososphaerales archaeon]
MQRPRVLLDTNILISGLAFTRGNEHAILRLLEDERITLVLARNSSDRSKQVLKEKFPGFEELLDIFLDRIDFELVRISEISPRIVKDSEKVIDKMPQFTPR